MILKQILETNPFLRTIHYEKVAPSKHLLHQGRTIVCIVSSKFDRICRVNILNQNIDWEISGRFEFRDRGNRVIISIRLIRVNVQPDKY